MSTHLNATIQVHADVPVHVDAYDVDGQHIIAIRLGDFFEGEMTIQGDAADIVHLVEVLRAEVAAAVGKAWPVETVHVDNTVVDFLNHGVNS